MRFTLLGKDLIEVQEKFDGHLLEPLGLNQPK
jgi:hypothetical protein